MWIRSDLEIFRNFFSKFWLSQKFMPFTSRSPQRMQIKKGVIHSWHHLWVHYICAITQLYPPTQCRAIATTLLFSKIWLSPKNRLAWGSTQRRQIKKGVTHGWHPLWTHYICTITQGYPPTQCRAIALTLLFLEKFLSQKLWLSLGGQLNVPRSRRGLYIVDTTYGYTTYVQ